MKTNLIDLIDFERINSLLESFNKTTGFVTAILDLEGNVLSKSGWRNICTDFHRVNAQTAKRCTTSDTELANKMAEGEKYHFYKCLNGLVDVAVPLVINGEHIANLFSGQFFFEKPDRDFFVKQAQKYGFNEKAYFEALDKVPIIPEDKVKPALDFLLDMTAMIAEMTMQRIDRKMFEDALIKSEEQFRGIFNNLQDAFFQADLTGRFTMVSPSALRIYGYDSVDELIGQPAKMLYADNQGRENMIKELRKKEHIEDFVVIGRKKDGSTFWASMNVRFIRNNKNEITGTEGVVRDITERKQTEEALRESEERFKALHNASFGGIGIHDKGIILECNRGLSDMTGYSYEELIGMDGLLLIAESARKMVMDNILSGYEKPYEAMGLRKNGDEFPLRLDGRNIPYKGKMVRTVEFRDITEQKQAEEKIKEHSSLIRIAAEKVKLGGWNVDLKENRSYWSDVVAAIHEMPSDYIPLVEEGIAFYAPEWCELITKVFTNCAENGVPYDEELEIITKTGKRVWVRTIGEAVRDENGKIYKVQGAFQDISEKKMIEEKIREKDLQFRKLSANVPDMIYQFTRKPDGTYCVPIASEGIKNIFGCTSEDVLDDFTPIANVLYPDDAAQVIEDIEYSAKHLTYFTCEFRVKIPGKDIQWIYSRSTPEKLPDGSITWYGFSVDITERKKGEEALKESEENHRNLLQNLYAGVVVHAADSNILYANDHASKLLGLSTDQLMGKTAIDPAWHFIQEDLKPMPIDQYPVQYVIANKVPLREQVLGINRPEKSDLVWVLVNAFPEFEPDGTLRQVVVTFIDITERKRAEAALYESESKFREMAELLPQIIFESDMQGNLTYLNKQAYKLSGYSEKDGLIGKSSLSFYIPEDREIALENIKQSLTGTKNAESNEYTIIRKDGSTFNVLVYSNPILKEDKPVGVRGIIVDISEIKQTQQELIVAKEKAEESEEKYKQIFDNTFDIMSIYEVTEDNRYKVITFNPAEAKLIGGIENYQNKYIDECISPEMYKEFRQNYERCIQEDSRIEYEENISFLELNKTFNTQLIPLKNAQGRIHRIIVISRDITENVLLNKQLKINNEELLKLNENLIVAKERAEESDRLKSAFLANMSHEIRTPLNSIIGFSELMTDPDYEPQQQLQFAQVINTSGNNLLAIISDIMDISKIEAGQLNIAKRRMSVRLMITNIRNEFNFKIQEKGLELRIDEPDEEEELFIVSDENRLKQVLVNLVINAIKFTKEGFIEIGVKTVKNIVQFYVKDTGIGIPEEFRDKIFERFRQVETALTRKYGGNGLGLPISKSLIELLGGNIWIESEVGVGSTFYFNLPIG